MSAILMIISIAAAAASLAWGYARPELEPASRWLLVIGILWLLAHWQRWYWIGSLGLLAFVAAAAVGLWIGLPPWMMILAAVGALIGWDLGSFIRRMRFASPRDDLRGLEVRHLARVGIVAILGGAIATLSVFVKVRIPFELAVVLALVGTLGLTRLAFWLQRENGS